jgi:hypothetical protein
MFNLDVHVYSLPITAARYNACGIRFLQAQALAQL